ncbi:Plant PDR ABC transporter associated [Musa troglodytarum]|uniref:Plant PDR ABC transporter associated n=1 Tax=Musa troglodytarum TaxID=320322 RepID=A0A9E7H1S0_9LILI|nr:Plant PDR ABC transporter associated [Musa troglodytarum]
MQVHPARSVECDGFDVRRGSVHGDTELFIGSAGGGRRTNSLLQERAAGMYSALPYAFGQAAKFFWYLFFMYFTLLYFTFYGMMAVGITPNHNIGSIVSAFFYAVWNLFAGFIIPRPSIPVWWRWYYWACPVAWTLYGLVASQFGDIHTPMEDPKGKLVSEYLRSHFGFKHSFLGVVAAVVVAFPVLFAFLFAFSIKMLNFQKR